jgi:hypothetical protein
LAKVAGTDTSVGAMKIIAAALKLEVKHLDEVFVPFANRWDMYNEDARIKGLLDNKAYRRRIVSLLMKTENKDDTKPRVVYIATNFITCSGMSINKSSRGHRGT